MQGATGQLPQHTLLGSLQSTAHRVRKVSSPEKQLRMLKRCITLKNMGNARVAKHTADAMNHYVVTGAIPFR